MMLRSVMAIGVAGMTMGLSAPQQASLVTAIAECHGEYDYAGLLRSRQDGLGLETAGGTLFGAPIATLTSSYSDEYDETIYTYTSRVRTSYATLKAQALKFHGAAACSEELTTPGSRRCAIEIAKARNGKKFYRHSITVSEEGSGASAMCVVNLGG